MAFDQLTNAVGSLISHSFSRAVKFAGTQARVMGDYKTALSFRDPPGVVAMMRQSQATQQRQAGLGVTMPTQSHGFSRVGPQGLQWLGSALNPSSSQGTQNTNTQQTASPQSHAGTGQAQNVTIANWPSGMGSSPGSVGGTSSGSANQGSTVAGMLRNAGSHIANGIRSMFGGGSTGHAAASAQGHAGGSGLVGNLASSVSHLSGGMKLALAGGSGLGGIGAAVGIMRWGLNMNHAAVEKMAGMAQYSTGLQNSFVSMAAADNARNYRSAAYLAPSSKGVAEAETAWRDASAGFGNRMQQLKNNISAPIANAAAKDLSGVNSMWDTASVMVGAKTWADLRKENEAAKNAANNYTPLSELIHQIGAGNFSKQKFKRLAPLNK